MSGTPPRPAPDVPSDAPPGVADAVRPEGPEIVEAGEPPSDILIEAWKAPQFLHGFTQSAYQQFYGLTRWPNFPPPPRE